MAASRKDADEIVNLLLAKGADVNETSKHRKFEECMMPNPHQIPRQQRPNSTPFCYIQKQPRCCTKTAGPEGDDSHQGQETAATSTPCSCDRIGTDAEIASRK